MQQKRAGSQFTWGKSGRMKTSYGRSKKGKGSQQEIGDTFLRAAVLFHLWFATSFMLVFPWALFVIRVSASTSSSATAICVATYLIASQIDLAWYLVCTTSEDYWISTFWFGGNGAPDDWLFLFGEWVEVLRFRHGDSRSWTCWGIVGSVMISCTWIASVVCRSEFFCGRFGCGGRVWARVWIASWIRCGWVKDLKLTCCVECFVRRNPLWYSNWIGDYRAVSLGFLANWPYPISRCYLSMMCLEVC